MFEIQKSTVTELGYPCLNSVTEGALIASRCLKSVIRIGRGDLIQSHKISTANIHVLQSGVTIKPSLYSIRAHTPTVGAAVYTSVAGCAQRIRRLSPSKFKHVELSRPAQTSAGIPANHESAPRSPRADALFCIGTYVDVYRRIRSPVYTFIHGATCAVQCRRAGSRKCGHLRRLPAHARALSINTA